MANSLYSSTEYQNLGYTSAEKVLTLYRGILNREPESLAGLQYWASVLDAGNPVSAVISGMVTSAEFANLRDNLICSTSANSADPVYRWGSNPAITINSGETGMTGDYLQSLLDAAKNSSNKTVTLGQRVVIYSNKKITVPAGVTLNTAGITDRKQYAKMARIVRTGHFGNPNGVRGDTALLSLENGATVDSIWVSGQRDAKINNVTLSYSLYSANIYLRGGTGTSVKNSRIDTVAGNTNMAIDGTAEGSPCANVSIFNNLIVGYSNTHYYVGTVGNYSDGITNACENATISSNHIIDSSDVGIIVFRSGNAAQKTQVYGNYVISSGISGFAALMMDPYIEVTAGTTRTYDFTGAAVYGNNFWTSADSHFDFGLAVGGRAWDGTNANTGTNGSMINNSNQGIPTTMQIGLAVDGMINTASTGNSFSYVRQSNGQCRTKAVVVLDPDSSRATPGTTQGPLVYDDLIACPMGPH